MLLSIFDLGGLIVLTRINHNINYFEKAMILFIIMQPIIDLLTSFSLLVLKVNVTFGIIFRFGMMVFVLVYLFFAVERQNRTRLMMYILILGLVLFIGFVNNLVVKDPINIFAEVKNIAKIIYAPVMLFGYIVVIYRLNKRTYANEHVQKSVYMAMLIVSIVMLLSIITGTAIESYKSEKIGWKGWFYAGNEIGAIMAISLPVVLIYAVRKTTSLKKLFYWIPVIMLIISLLLIGTKVGYFSSLILLIVSLISIIYERVKNRNDRQLRKKYNLNFFVNSIVLVLFLLSTPITPLIYNTNIHMSWLGYNNQVENAQKTPNEQNGSSARKIIPNDPDAVENILLSGREDFLKLHKSYFKKAPLTQKLFGMGYGSNYEQFSDRGKTIEMDFYDIFFSFGILGFTIYLLPFIYLAFVSIWSILKNIKEKLNLETILIGSGILLGMGIAYTAGHVLTAPAVSIYLIILIAYFYNLLKYEH